MSESRPPAAPPADHEQPGEPIRVPLHRRASARLGAVAVLVVVVGGVLARGADPRSGLDGTTAGVARDGVRDAAAGGASEAVLLVSPGDGARRRGGTRFTWRSTPGAVAYVLDLSTADGRALLRLRTADTVIALGGAGPSASAWRWRVTAERRDGTSIHSPLRTLGAP